MKKKENQKRLNKNESTLLDRMSGEKIESFKLDSSD